MQILFTGAENNQSLSRTVNIYLTSNMPQSYRAIFGAHLGEKETEVELS